MGKQKRKHMFINEQPNLKRFRLSVREFAGDSHDNIDKDKSKCGHGSLSRVDRFGKKVVGLLQNRKRKRKDARKLKKKRCLEFSQRKGIPTAVNEEKKKADQVVKEKDNQIAEKKAELKTKKKAKKKEQLLKKKALAKKQKEERDKELKNQAFFAAIQQDDRSIKQIEKLLKLNKRKSKNLPKSFLDDGLDYLLDVVDEDKVKTLYQDSDDDASFQGEFDDEGDKSSDQTKSLDVSKNCSLDDEDEFEESSEESSEEGENLKTVNDASPPKSILKEKIVEKDGMKGARNVKWKDDITDMAKLCGDSSKIEQPDIGDGDVKIKSMKKSKAAVLKEDIYGRLRDKEGNVVKDTKTYVPPALRMKISSLDEKSKLKLERLNKQLKGLVNRASESNMQPICKQIEGLYMSNSHGQMNELLTSIIMSACVSVVMTPERLAMELMMLVAILHHNVGSEVGAVLIQSFATRFDALYRSGCIYGQGKEIDNIVMLFAHLYNFKVIDSLLIFDILKKFVDPFGEKDIELLLLLLRHVGFSLRRDDPALLKTVIQEIQIKANAVETAQFEDQSRVKFMLDILLAIKNNNMRKIPNYDPDHLDHLRKLIRNYVRTGSLGDAHLRIGLDDLLNAEDKGRWWVVGSAWEGKLKDDAQSKSTVDIVGDVSGSILALALKQRMNTDIRKNIFCIIMTCEDYVDAFEKLLHLGLKNQQEREIIHVITDCCLQEKMFNPFYSYLMQKFCEYDRRFQMTFQFSMWDRFKEMGNLSKINSSNLAKLLSHLLATKAMSLSVFKAVEFGTLDKNMVHFLKQVLTKLLLDYPVNIIEDVFLRIATLQKLHLLHEGLKLFMHHFLTKKENDKEDPSTLSSRVTLAEKILSRQSTSSL